jgi:hypothetical protein
MKDIDERLLGLGVWLINSIALYIAFCVGGADFNAGNVYFANAWIAAGSSFILFFMLMPISIIEAVALQIIINLFRKLWRNDPNPALS